jgi:hypothetical protein
MAAAYELCQAADGSLLFQSIPNSGSEDDVLQLLPRDQARLYSMPPLVSSLKAGTHLESQAQEAVDALAGARAPLVLRAVRCCLNALLLPDASHLTLRTRATHC